MNVVFDLGGVVFDWQPDALVRRVFGDPETEALVLKEMIAHADWIELDRGTLSLDDAIVRGTLRTGLPEESIAQLFDAVPESLTPIEATFNLVQGDLPRWLDALEKKIVLETLAAFSGNQSSAARHLGLTESGLRYKLSKWKDEQES